jgi:hypothetical protein
MSEIESSVGDMPLMSRATTMNATHDNDCPGVVRKMTAYDTYWIGCCYTCGWYGTVSYDAVEAV